MDHNHHRSTSNSYRIAMAHAQSTTSSSHHNHSKEPPSNAHPPSPSRTRTLRSRHAKGVSTVSRLRSSLLEWLNGRVFSRRGGPRRWMVVLAVATIYVLRQSYFKPASLSRHSSWSRLGSSELDLETPVIDRGALEKLRLLEIHFGADDDTEEESLSTLRLEEQPVRLADQLRPAKSTKDGTAATTTEDDAVPLVAAIPDVPKPNPAVPTPLVRAPAHIADAEMCPERNGEPCRFLFAAWLGEQETKAQLHIYQLGLLAAALNRTLVVPNVDRSRLSTCNTNPFSFYYREDALSRLGITAVYQDDLIAWAERRDPPATAQVVSLATATATYPSGAIEIDSASDALVVPNNARRNLCLRPPRSRIDFSDYSPLTIYPPEQYHKTEKLRMSFGESVVNTLRSEEVGSRSSRASASRKAAYALPDILAFNYELRYPLLSPSVVSSFNPDIEPIQPFEHFPYADMWMEYAEKIIANLSPFIAIHWRTEKLSPTNLAPCATSLIRTLAAYKAAHPHIRTVYLATDYPIEALDGAGEGVPHSGTFAKVITEEHHAVFRKFLRDFARALPEIRLTTFVKESELVSLPANLDESISIATRRYILKNHDGVMPTKIEEIDSGLYGIIDKTIATRAELFVAGVAGTGVNAHRSCAKASSFTAQIIAAREVVLAEQTGSKSAPNDQTAQSSKPGTLWNDVEYFDLKSGKGPALLS